MSSTKSKIALAAALAAMSLPAFAADEATSSITGDPTWPAIEHPAPALAVNAAGGEVEALRTDPLFPVTDSAAPSIALVPYDVEGPQTDPVEEWAPPAPYAVDLTPSASRVAKAK
jgi:hypothetical protein